MATKEDSTSSKKKGIDEDATPTTTTKEAKEKANDNSPVAAPHGILCKWVSDSNAEKLGLKAGEGIRDLVAYKLFKVEFVRDHAQKFGNLSEFEPLIRLLDDAKYPFEEEDVLVSSDLEKTYGEYWLFHYTIASKRAFFEELERKKKEKAAEKEKARRAEEERKRREEAERNMVWVQSDGIAPSKNITSSADVLEEMEFVRSRDADDRARKRLTLKATTLRSNLRQPYTFNDSDGDSASAPGAAGNAKGGGGGGVGFRSKMDPNFDMQRKQIDLGFQSPTSLFANHSDAGTQTVRFTTKHRATSYEPQKVRKKIQQKRRTNVSKFVEFLDRGCFLAERALQSNEVADMYKDDMKSILPKDIFVFGNSDQTDMKPLRSFTHLIYSKGKRLSSVDWHPKRPGVLLVSCTDNRTFDERAEICGRARDAYSLIWNFRDLLNPERVLRSPSEAGRVAYNPTNARFVAGGLLSGRVILWILQDEGDEDGGDAKTATKIEAVGTSNDDSPMRGGGGGASGGSLSSSSPSSLVVEYALISSIDASHRSPVTDLQWLPNAMELDKMGRVTGRNAENKTFQFATVSLDGQILFWDTRDLATLSQKSAGTKKKRQEDKETSSDSWLPFYRTGLVGSKHKKMKGFGLTRILFDMDVVGKARGVQRNKHAATAKVETSSGTVLPSLKQTPTSFSATTEEGQLIYADWRSLSNAEKTKLLRSVGHVHGSTRGGGSSSSSVSRMPSSPSIVSGPSGGDSSSGSNDDASGAQQRMVDESTKSFAGGGGRNASGALIGGATTEVATTQKVQAAHVTSVHFDHVRPAVDLRRSPFYYDIVLTVSDYTFNIWKEGVADPIFMSPLASSTIHCGLWSPSRPGVLLIGKANGEVDVWDFTDSSHKPRTSIQVNTSGVTSMKLSSSVSTVSSPPITATKSSSSKTKTKESSAASTKLQEGTRNSELEFLAAGGSSGSLQIFEMPTFLCKPLTDEFESVRVYFTREARQTQYVHASRLLLKKTTTAEGNDGRGPSSGPTVGPESKTSKKEAVPSGVVTSENDSSYSSASRNADVFGQSNNSSETAKDAATAASSNVAAAEREVEALKAAEMEYLRIEKRYRFIFEKTEKSKKKNGSSGKSKRRVPESKGPK
eukprot:g3625.t1